MHLLIFPIWLLMQRKQAESKSLKLTGVNASQGPELSRIPSNHRRALSIAFTKIVENSQNWSTENRGRTVLNGAPKIHCTETDKPRDVRKHASHSRLSDTNLGAPMAFSPASVRVTR